MGVCVVYVYSSESEMVSKGEEMEDYYLVYCIYILSILSFTPKSLFFCSQFVIVWTLLPVFKIPMLSCDTLDIF